MRIVVREQQTDVIIIDRTFEDEAVYVGSQPGCAVHLPDLRVAGRQLLISPDENGTWMLEAVDTENTVLVGGQPLGERRPLGDGEQIAVGEYTMTVHLTGESAGPAAEEERLSPADLAEIKKYPLPPGSFTKRTGDPVSLTMSQVNGVSRAALELARCRDLHELVDVSLTQLLQNFRGRCAWIGLRRQSSGDLEVVGGRYASGEPADAPELARHLQYRCLVRSQMILVRRAEDPVIGSGLAVPLKTSLGVLGMIYVDVRKSTKRVGTADLDAFIVVASQIAQQLEAILREQVRLTARVSSTELSVVKAIQERLDPRGMPSWREFQFAAFSMAGQESCGDVYDVMKLPGKEMAGAVVAHVNAEGSLLSLLMAQTHAAFEVAMVHGDLPHVYLKQLNHLLYGAQQERYVACFVVLVDPATGIVRHCRAGRIGAIVVDAKGQPRPFGAIGMPAVGIQKGFEYATTEEPIAPGETLVLYTGGVATASNAAGERFREKRFIEGLCDNFGQPAATVVEDLKSEITGFIAGGAHPDDMTVLLVHRSS